MAANDRIIFTADLVVGVATASVSDDAVVGLRGRPRACRRAFDGRG
jgi:hypothetical protein